MAGAGSAPVYMVPGREIVAVEHPMAIKNIDNALKTFGRGAPFAQVRRMLLDLMARLMSTPFASFIG
jgi:hypothetical protein